MLTHLVNPLWKAGLSLGLPLHWRNLRSFGTRHCLIRFGNSGWWSPWFKAELRKDLHWLLWWAGSCLCCWAFLGSGICGDSYMVSIPPQIPSRAVLSTGPSNSSGDVGSVVRRLVAPRSSVLTTHLTSIGFSGVSRSGTVRRTYHGYCSAPCGERYRGLQSRGT